jgi:hypothetical protein
VDADVRQPEGLRLAALDDAPSDAVAEAERQVRTAFVALAVASGGDDGVDWPGDGYYNFFGAPTEERRQKGNGPGRVISVELEVYDAGEAASVHSGSPSARPSRAPPK